MDGGIRPGTRARLHSPRWRASATESCGDRGRPRGRRAGRRLPPQPPHVVGVRPRLPPRRVGRDGEWNEEAPGTRSGSAGKRCQPVHTRPVGNTLKQGQAARVSCRAPEVRPRGGEDVGGLPGGRQTKTRPASAGAGAGAARRGARAAGRPTPPARARRRPGCQAAVRAHHRASPGEEPGGQVGFRARAWATSSAATRRVRTTPAP